MRELAVQHVPDNDNFRLGIPFLRAYNATFILDSNAISLVGNFGAKPMNITKKVSMTTAKAAPQTFQHIIIGVTIMAAVCMLLILAVIVSPILKKQEDQPEEEEDDENRHKV